MRIYVIGNDGITLCREAPASVTDGEIAVASKEEFHAAPPGEREWFALYQQRPHPIEGSIFQVSQIGVISASPAGGMLCRGWDLAATKEGGGRDPSWTRGVLLQRAPDGRFVVRDVASVRGGPDEVERAIKNTAQQDGHRVKISLPQDPGQAGKSQVLYYTRALSGWLLEQGFPRGVGGISIRRTR
jgi:phage terminase large subunit-like protein